MEDDEILKYSMQIAMLKQLLNKKLIDEKEYEKIKKELMKEYGVLSDLVIWREKLTSLECVALQHSEGIFVGYRYYDKKKMEVKIIQGNKSVLGAFHRKVKKLRVAAYCRVSTDDEDQIKSYNSMIKYYTDLIQKNEE